MAQTETESKFNDVLKTLVDQFNHAVTLETYTVVADVDVVVNSEAGKLVDISFASTPPADATKSEKALYTAINQFSGDVRTVWGKGTDPDADTTLFATHNENVKLGGDIFVRNIKMVADLVKKFAE